MDMDSDEEPVDEPSGPPATVASPSVPAPTSRGRTVTWDPRPPTVPEEPSERRRSRSPHREGSSDRPDLATLCTAAFWCSEHSEMVCLELDVTPQTPSQFRELQWNSQGFVTTQLRRQRVEVRPRYLSHSEREGFKEAKDREIASWVRNQVVELAQDKWRSLPESIMNMRWVLTWKELDESEQTEESSRKPKARLVIRGHMDPHLGETPTSSPTPSRSARQMFFSIAALRGYVVESADVSTAFLQGKSLSREKFVRGVEELCAAFGQGPGCVLKVCKGAYGLVEAPREWHDAVKARLLELKFAMSIAEPCCFSYCIGGQLLGLILFHVDDFLIAGPEGHEHWDTIVARPKYMSKWGVWMRASWLSLLSFGRGRRFHWCQSQVSRASENKE